MWVEKPTRGEAVEILRGLRTRFEEHHRVEIAPDALEAAVDLSIRYIYDFRLPDTHRYLQMACDIPGFTRHPRLRQIQKQLPA